MCYNEAMITSVQHPTLHYGLPYIINNTISVKIVQTTFLNDQFIVGNKSIDDGFIVGRYFSLEFRVW